MANGDLISSEFLQNFKHAIPASRSPSKPKRLINLRKFGGNNERLNWKTP